MVTKKCWHCSVVSQMVLPKTEFRYPEENELRLFFPPITAEYRSSRSFILYQCSNCGYANFQEVQVVSGRPLRETGNWWPKDTVQVEYTNDVPSDVAQAAKEAHECYSAGCYKATVIMVRSVLEGIVNKNVDGFKRNENGMPKCSKRGKPSEKDFATKLKELDLNKNLNEQAQAIKSIGDTATHNIFEDIGEDEADTALMLLDTIIDEIYIRQAKLKRLNQKSEEVNKRKMEQASKSTS